MTALHSETYLRVPGHLFMGDAIVLQEIMSGKKVLEMGTHLGKATVAMAATAASVDTIDWYQGDRQIGGVSFAEAIANIKEAGAAEKVRMFNGDWTAVVREETKLENYDAIFYDAAHTKEDTAYEWTLLEMLLDKPHILVAVHDYKPEEAAMRDVVEAVDRFEQATGRKRQGPLLGSSVVWFEPI